MHTAVPGTGICVCKIRTWGQVGQEGGETHSLQGHIFSFRGHSGSSGLFFLCADSFSFQIQQIARVILGVFNTQQTNMQK